MKVFFVFNFLEKHELTFLIASKLLVTREEESGPCLLANDGHILDVFNNKSAFDRSEK